MHYLGWFMLLLGAIRLLVAFVNWASNMYLPQNRQLKHQPFVSVLIPARNEENNIANLLADLSTFHYPTLEIIVYNDNSTDNTASIVNKFVSANNKIKLINGNEPEKGWLGKNYACHQLSMAAKGEMFLFLDADVRVGNELIEKSLAYTERHNLKLLSIFPKQLMSSFGTQLAVPIMNWILLSLLPLFLVRWSGWSSFSAANGQFMLFEAVTYNQLLPHSFFRTNKVEDIAIIKYYKTKHLQVATLLGDKSISCSMYNNMNEAIDGFSKNIFQFFGGSIFVTIFFALLTSIAPFYILIYNGLIPFMAYITIIFLIRLFVSLASKQSIFKNLILSIPQHIVFLYIIVNAYNQKRNNKLVWKNREINSK